LKKNIHYSSFFLTKNLVDILIILVEVQQFLLLLKIHEFEPRLHKKKSRRRKVWHPPHIKIDPWGLYELNLISINNLIDAHVAGCLAV